MNCEESLRQQLRTIEVNDDFTEAVLWLRDDTRLCFCHRVGERWAKSVGPDGHEAEGGLASRLLESISMFRLNRKHLDILFRDGSRWDRPAGAS